MSQQKITNRWLVVVGAMLIQLCLGAIYGWGAFTVALTDKAPEVAMKLEAELIGVKDQAKYTVAKKK